MTSEEPTHEAAPPNTRPVKVRLYSNSDGSLLSACEYEALFDRADDHVAEVTVHVPVKDTETKQAPKLEVGQRVRFAGQSGIVTGFEEGMVRGVCDSGTILLVDAESLIPLREVTYNVYRGEGYHVYTCREGTPGDARCVSDGNELLHSFELEEEDRNE